MATTVGMKLALEGEKTYKAQLQAIQQQTKELAAEMKKVVSAGGSETDMMVVLNKQIQNTQKYIEALTSKYEKQQKSIEDTKKALAEAEKEYGENSVEVQKLKTELAKQETQLSKTKTEINNQTAQLNKLGIEELEVANDSKDLSKETENGGKKAKEAKEGYTVLKGVIADLAASAIKAAVEGMKKLASAVIDLSKQAIMGYAEMEQLEGGVEKLFGEDAAKVIQNASKAYKTAGMDANAYMETVTGVSASLISSLGGDTAKAAEMADMMISDMADNANVFGTSMEDVQTVYTSLSKGQFQTLDNLKLGFSGSKAGMQELIAEAEKLNSSFVAQRDDAGNLTMEYSDMVQAIHIVQENMNITGTTAKEAANTISGSISSTKAAWQNLVANLGNSNADIGALAKEVIDSAMNVFHNVTPIIKNIVQAIPEALNSIIEAIEESDLLNEVIDTAMGILDAILQQLPEMLNTIITKVIEILPELMNSLMEILPSLLDTVIKLVTDLISHLSEIIQPILDALPEIVRTILGALPELIRIILREIPEIIDAILSMFPEIITAICDALPDIIIAIIEELPHLIGSIAKSVIENFPQILAAVVMGLATIIVELGKWFGSVLKPVGEFFGNIFRKIGEFFSGIWQKVTEGLWNVYYKVTSWRDNLMQTIGNFISNLWSNIWGFVSSLPGKIWEGLKNIGNVGLNLIKGLWNGIADGAKWLWDKITGWASDLIGGIKSLFGIHSPSKEMAFVGEMLTAGLTKGIEKTADQAVDATRDMVRDINGALLWSEGSGALMAESASAINNSTNNWTVNVYGTEGQDVKQLAEYVAEEIQRSIDRKGAVYA